MPARVAERVAPTRGRRGAIDAESEEVTDEPVDADRTDGIDADTGDRPDDESRDGADPLAELEAEMEAEERSGRGGGGDPPRGSKPEE
jgi:hypothetical protein